MFGSVNEVAFLLIVVLYNADMLHINHVYTDAKEKMFYLFSECECSQKCLSSISKS